MLEHLVDHRPARSGFPPMARMPRSRPPRKELYAEGGVEPALEDLISDPLTEVLMQRDGVSVDSLRELISDARRRLRERASE